MGTIWSELLGTEFRQAYYDANGVRTRAIEAGEGLPLVFVHGQGGHAEAFTRNLAAHAKHFHAYAIDMVGHGFSDKPDLPYVIDDLVEHVRSFLDCIGAKRAYLCGQSLGAIVVSWLAIRYPERVARLTLVTGILAPPDEKGREQYRDVIGRSRAAAEQPTTEAIRKRMEWLVVDPANLTDELIAARLRIYSQPGMGPILNKIARGVLGPLVEPDGWKRWHDPEKLRGIKCPTLVVWTRHNPGQSLAVAEQGLKMIGDARLVVFENSAHWPQWEEAEGFNQENLNFLVGEGA